jgi:hypothetical protein
MRVPIKSMLIRIPSRGTNAQLHDKVGSEDLVRDLHVALAPDVNQKAPAEVLVFFQ